MKVIGTYLVCLWVVEVPCISIASPFLDVEWGQITAQLITEVIKNKGPKQLVQQAARGVTALPPHIPFRHSAQTQQEFRHLKSGPSACTYKGNPLLSHTIRLFHQARKACVHCQAH